MFSDQGLPRQALFNVDDAGLLTVLRELEKVEVVFLVEGEAEAVEIWDVQRECSVTSKPKKNLAENAGDKN